MINNMLQGWSMSYMSRILNAPFVYVDPDHPEVVYCKPEDEKEVKRILQGIIDGTIIGDKKEQVA